MKVIIDNVRRILKYIPPNSVDLVLTSPPYYVGKPYGEVEGNLEYAKTFKDYLDGLFKCWKNLVEVLRSGCRLVVVVADTWRRPYIPLHSYIINQLESIKSLEMEGVIIWDKMTTGNRTSWGSWCLPSNPYIRDRHEYVLVFKKRGERKKPTDREVLELSKLNRDVFLEMTQSIWRIPPESAKEVGHPAPFPVELAKRMIMLYTFITETVLDPFLGSGTTCAACVDLARSCIGFEVNPSYIEVVKKRIGWGRQPLTHRVSYELVVSNT